MRHQFANDFGVVQFGASVFFLDPNASLNFLYARWAFCFTDPMVEDDVALATSSSASRSPDDSGASKASNSSFRPVGALVSM